MNRFGMQLYVKLAQIKQFLKEERGAVDIVAVVILIAIAVVLAVFFRQQVTDLVKNMFSSINENAEGINDTI